MQPVVGVSRDEVATFYFCEPNCYIILCDVCGTELDESEARHSDGFRLSSSLCFDCYLESDEVLYEYSDRPVERFEAQHQQAVRDALNDKLRYVLTLSLSDDPQQLIVLFAVSIDDAEELQKNVLESKFGTFIDDTEIHDLGDLYDGLDTELCWNISAWKHDPHGRPLRKGPMSIDIFAGVPCVIDSYGWLNDGYRSELCEELLSHALPHINFNEIETLSDGVEAAQSVFPVASDFGISIPIRDYLRDNPQYLSERSRRQINTGSDPEDYTQAATPDLKQLHEEVADPTDNKEAQIRDLLEAAEQGLPSQALADAVDCSTSYARRFKYDEDAEAAVEKEWSRRSQAEKVSAATRERIIERDGNECLRCGGTENLSPHHIIPVAVGGENTDENLATLCKTCHLEAHDGAFSTPTTVYDDPHGFDEWLTAGDS
ncbi:hypothetical protein GCM10009067_41150 [Haloarcula sebkhae]|uniref:HNH nuclease domain-containing protein n=1 Tax=Haloarcula sebkhae TaxID=932660 RepID=A0A830F7X8_9EURY|nr:hypothetical protein GCM10009067_41150 [Haloarcula sebkhae]